jgi:DMSO reductase anchor subunit
MSSAVTSYVIFTVFSQMSVGALIAMVIADFLAKSKEDAGFFETGAWVSVPIAIIGLIAMLSHEARPMQAMMTMTNNLGTSWLSREVLAFTIFFILAIIYTIMWVLEPEYGSLKKFPWVPALVGKLMPLRKPVGVLGAIVGFAYLGVGARAYMMPTMPALNQPTTPLFFVVTALLAGITAVAAVLSLKYLMKKEGEEPLARMLWITMGIAVVMVIVLAVGLIANATLLQTAPTKYASVALHETLALLATEYASLNLARWIIGVGLALIFAIVLVFPLKKKNMAAASGITVLLFLVVLIGELIGRTVFFGTNVPTGEVMPPVQAFYYALGL